MRRQLLLLVAAGVLAIAACAQPEPSVPVGEGLPPISVVRTGGIAGVQDRLQIDPDGRWSLTTRRSSATTGQLDAAAMVRIVQILGDPDLDTQVAAANSENCADQFEYELSLSGRQLTFDDCGPLGPLLVELLQLLQEQTGF